MEQNQPNLPFSPEGGGRKQYPRPKNLKRVVSISTAMTAEAFYRLLKKFGVTSLLDTRLGRSYENARFSHESDFPYLTRVHGIDYVHAHQFSPTLEMRKVLDETFKSAKGPDRDPSAWTKFLKTYEDLLIERKPLQDPAIRHVLNAGHEAVAILCACPHHDDCHRSYACGVMVNYIEGLELVVAYPTDTEPKRASPRRYRVADFPHAGLRVNMRGVRS